MNPISDDVNQKKFGITRKDAKTLFLIAEHGAKNIEAMIKTNIEADTIDKLLENTTSEHQAYFLHRQIHMQICDIVLAFPQEMYKDALQTNLPDIAYQELFMVNVWSILDFLYKKDLLENYPFANGKHMIHMTNIGKHVEDYKLSGLVSENKQKWEALNLII